MVLFFWIPVMLIGLTLFVPTQFETEKGPIKVPLWFFFLFILYFIPVGNFLIFLFVMSTLAEKDLQLKKGSILHKFKKVIEKPIKILTREVKL